MNAPITVQCAACGNDTDAAQEYILCQDCLTVLQTNQAVSWDNNAESTGKNKKFMFHVIIPGFPQAKMRHRTAGKKTYNPQSEVERSIQWEIRQHLPSDYKQTGKPLILNIEAYFPRPKKHYGTGRNDGVLKKSAPEYYDKKPDADNVLKFYKDCMNGLIYNDDSQVFDSRCAQHYCDIDDPGRVEITVYEP